MISKNVAKLHFSPWKFCYFKKNSDIAPRKTIITNNL